MKTTINNTYQTPPATIADYLRSIKMSWIWTAVFLIVVFLLGVLKPAQTLEYLIENKGMGEAGETVLGMIAGYTFPMTLGFTIIMFYLVSGKELSLNPQGKL